MAELFAESAAAELATSTKGGGRELRARRQISKDELVHSSPVLAVVVFEEHKEHLCTGCLNVGLEPFTLQCDVCRQAFFCCSSCMVRACSSTGDALGAQHQAVCPIQQRWNPPTSSGPVLTLLRLLLHIYARALGAAGVGHSNEAHAMEATDTRAGLPVGLTAAALPAAAFPSPLAALRQLHGHLPADAREIRQTVAWLHEALSTSPLKSIAPATAEALFSDFCRLECNCFSLVDSQGGVVGHALYPAAAVGFNHDCDPNCFASEAAPDEGTLANLQIHALRDINVGEELTLGYLDSSLPRVARQRLLQKRYHFSCSCLRCEQQTRDELQDQGHFSKRPRMLPESTTPTFEDRLSGLCRQGGLVARVAAGLLPSEVGRFIGLCGQGLRRAAQITPVPLDLRVDICLRMQAPQLEGLVRSGCFLITGARLDRRAPQRELEAAFTALGGHQPLVVLEAAGCRGLMALPITAGGLAARELDLSGCPKLRDLGGLSIFSALRRLSVARCAALEDISPLRAAVGLQVLDIGSCTGIRDLSSLAACQELRDLDAQATSVRDISPLASCHNLVSLNLSGCRRLSDVSPLTACRQLRRLCLRSCPRLADISMLQDCAELAVLDLTGCSGLAAPPGLAERCDVRVAA